MNSFKIMIVDDDVIFGALLERMLMKTFTTMHCITGDTFRQQAYAFQPDIIFMDIQIGTRTTGFELVEWYRQHHGKAQVIFMSSFDTAEILSRVYSCGGNDYILKPVSPSVLKEKIDLALEWSLLDGNH